ncbi:PREDICTED: DNA polymerase subunit gamma-2, mitochondrial-like [Amphimedon queenslandica]|nr:PREDICTED: DNA polymerase subunit gamma-2, mitochondrial-like [Amphimedon queenslandica]|eukprot:XP_019851892.1 PREDICTED: DNA polymerase subunit gamma-2, mitochondrial-like [Amphimedon queenslandica]
MFSLCTKNGFFLTTEAASSIISSSTVQELLQTVVGYGPLGAAMRRNFITEWEYSTVSASSANVHLVHSPFNFEMATPKSVATNWLKFLEFPLPFGLSFYANSSNTSSLYNREQLHLYYVCPSFVSQEWIIFWQRSRLQWWKQFACRPENFVLDEKNSYIKFILPNTELNQDSEYIVIENIDTYQLKNKSVLHFMTRLDTGLWSILRDAFFDNYRQWTDESPINALLKIHRRLAPIKLAFLPEENVQDQVMFCDKLASELNMIPITSKSYNEGSLESRLAYQDEIGTPMRVLIDDGTISNGVITLQDRDSGISEHIGCDSLVRCMQIMHQRY